MKRPPGYPKIIIVYREFTGLDGGEARLLFRGVSKPISRRLQTPEPSARKPARIDGEASSYILCSSLQRYIGRLARRHKSKPTLPNGLLATSPSSRYPRSSPRLSLRFPSSCSFPASKVKATRSNSRDCSHAPLAYEDSSSCILHQNCISNCSFLDCQLGRISFSLFLSLSTSRSLFPQPPSDSRTLPGVFSSIFLHLFYICFRTYSRDCTDTGACLFSAWRVTFIDNSRLGSLIDFSIHECEVMGALNLALNQKS